MSEHHGFAGLASVFDGFGESLRAMSDAFAGLLGLETSGQRAERRRVERHMERCRVRRARHRKRRSGGSGWKGRRGR